MRKNRTTLTALVLAIGFCTLAHAESEPYFLHHQRAAFAEKGFSVGFSSVEDFISVIKGGLRQKDTYMGVVDLDVTFDTAKAGLWPGGKFYVHGMNTHSGKKPSEELVGDIQLVDGNEGPRMSRLQEFWYEQSLFDERLSILGGVHDANTEFFVSDNASLFVNSAFGMTTSVANNVSSPAYPYPGLGARINWNITEKLGLRAGVYDSDPGDSTTNPHSPNMHWTNKAGSLTLLEGTWNYGDLPKTKLPGYLKVGTWYDSKSFDDVAAVDDNGDPIVHHGNYGAYAIWDQMFWKEAENQGLAFFIVGGGAPQDRNQVDMNIASGFNYTGLIPKRDEDQVGIAMTQSSLSNKQRKAEGLDAAETTIEGTYRFVLNQWVALQPDIQYVVNPGGNPDIKNATVFAFRCEVVY